MIKKVLSAAMALTMVASMAVISAYAEKGDVDNSGKLDIEDVAIVMNHINGVKKLSDEGMSAADTNADGTVDIEDVVSMINSINGIAPSADGTKTYENEIYTFKYGSKWEAGEEDGNDVNLHYVGEDASYSVTIAFLEDGTHHISSFDDLEAYAKSFMEFLLKNDGYTIVSQNRSKFNEYDSYEYLLDYKNSDGDLDIRIIFVNNGDEVILISPMSDKGVSSDVTAEAEKVLSTFKFK